jgi:heptosyltransferase III
MSKPRILAIRGGAIGDFILTLPAIRLLRETFAHCHLEILGYQHIAALARQGGPQPETTYADAVRHIEAGPLAGFFARNGNLSPEWSEYFASFNQVVSWLFDPDEIFANNVKRAGVKNYLSAYAKITDEAHASNQLARGLERMALFLDEPTAKIVPDAPTLATAQGWLNGFAGKGLIALHPGSGSAKKNWPLAHWRAVAEQWRALGHRILLVGGEADDAGLEALKPLADVILRGRSLPELGAALSLCQHYYGHDTGISHLAAAVGVPCTLLFGPTEPAVWAPQAPQVRILTAPEGDLAALPVEKVAAAGPAK